VIHTLKGLDLSGGVEEKKKQFDDLGITTSHTRKDDLLSFGGPGKLADSKLKKKRTSDSEFVSEKKKSNTVFKPMD
jgi:hypothetical protein